MQQTVVKDKNHEDEAARNLLASMGEIPGAVVTFDALHTRGSTTQQVVEKNKADYFVMVKNNARNLKTAIVQLFEEKDRRIETAESFDKGHGRIETRKVEVIKVKKGEISFPYCNTIGKITRKRETQRAGKVIKVTNEVEFFSSSCKMQKNNADFLLSVAREHWSIENKLHHVKDRSMNEDRISARGAYARIIGLLRSMAAMGLNGVASSIKCAQRVIASDKKKCMQIMRSKSLSELRLSIL